VGENATEEYMITYYLKDRITVGDLKLEIYDKDGKLAGTTPGTKRKGINRVTWSMRMKPPKVATGARIDGGGFSSPMVTDGEYTVKVKKGDKTYEGKITLVADPKSAHTITERQMQRETAMKLYKMQEDLAFLNKQLLALKDSVKARMVVIKNEKVKKNLSIYSEKLEKLRKTLVATKEGSAITGEEQIREKLSAVYGGVVGYEGRPTDSQLDRMKGMEVEIQNALKASTVLFGVELEAVNKQLPANRLTLMNREAFDKMAN
jgi:hypothetical protein